MKIHSTPIEGLIVIEPDVYKDSRGLFFESWNENKFAAQKVPSGYVQDNESHSSKNVIRGLHYQKAPHEQGKLVRVTRGAVLDVAVDIRPDSPAFGKYYMEELSERNFKMMWIPPGFAHGFLTLEDDTIFLYKCTGYYNKGAESGIRYNDPTINIPWGIEKPLLSDKDILLPLFNEIKF